MAAIYCDAKAGEQCTYCGRKLVGIIRLLELDMRDQRYKDSQDVPLKESQGWFPFGLACAKRMLRKEGQGTSQ